MALVSNDEEKLATTEGKEVDLGHKAKRAKDAFQDLCLLQPLTKENRLLTKSKKACGFGLQSLRQYCRKRFRRYYHTGAKCWGLGQNFRGCHDRNKTWILWGAGKFADRLWEAALRANWRHRFKEPLCEEANEVATVSFAVCLASKALSLLRHNNAITYS